MALKCKITRDQLMDGINYLVVVYLVVAPPIGKQVVTATGFSIDSFYFMQFICAHLDWKSGSLFCFGRCVHGLKGKYKG